MKALDKVLGDLMERYKQRVPDVQGILKAMCDEGLLQDERDIQNDHIAFRTLGVPHLGLGSFEKIFLHYGYEQRGYYHFPVKRLDAFWYAPPEPGYPRIFVSELRVRELSPECQAIIKEYTQHITHDPVDDLDLNDGEAVSAFLHKPLWPSPTWEEYQQLAKESEYAAWVLNNRYYLNHFTISVHNLPEGYRDLESFNAFLERHGFQLNDSGSKIKRSPDGLLLQSATVAQKVEVPFRDGQGGEVMRAISGSYVEFAERKVLPPYQHIPADKLKEHHRRDGFEADNADKIFESTYSSQTDRAKA